jgi:flagellar assembly factor FliW
MKAEIETMLIHSVNFGDIEVPEDKIISFKEGLPGFPQIRRFTMLELEELKPFQYLQSLDDPPIALLVINPFLVDEGYKFDLTPADMDEIRTTSPENVAVFAVATVPEEPEKATLNLMAPILINESVRVGKQVILHDSGFSVKHPLFNALKKWAIPYGAANASVWHDSTSFRELRGGRQVREIPEINETLARGHGTPRRWRHGC